MENGNYEESSEPELTGRSARLDRDDEDHGQFLKTDESWKDIAEKGDLADTVPELNFVSPRNKYEKSTNMINIYATPDPLPVTKTILANKLRETSPKKHNFSSTASIKVGPPATAVVASKKRGTGTEVFSRLYQKTAPKKVLAPPEVTKAKPISPLK